MPSKNSKSTKRLYTVLRDYLSFCVELPKIQFLIYKKWLLAQFSIYQNIQEFKVLSNEKKETFFNEKTISFFLQDLKLERTPFYLPDIYLALSILQKISLNQLQNILIYGDRDADGVTSAVSLYLFFKNYLNIGNKKINVLFPLEDDKYGITEEVASRIVSYKPNIIFILDCGSANKDTIEMIKKEIPQVLIIILDHHFLPQEEDHYPLVSAFINPKRLPINFPERELCTSVLVYKLISAFIFSYTSEFNRTYEISQGTYIRNGCLVDLDKVDLNVVTKYTETKLFLDKLDSNHLLYRIIPLGLKKKISLKQKIWFAQLAHLHKYLEKVKVYIPFAVIGTIADMVPLTGDNKILVAQGLKQMKVANSQFLNGLQSLCKMHNLTGEYTPIVEQDVGFLIAPSINAAGRLGIPEVAFQTLISQDPLESLKIASKLLDLNKKRKEFSTNGVKLLTDVLHSENNQNEKIAVYYHQDIHRGISGLLANKLAQSLKKSIIVMVDDGIHIRGSIRAYQNENVLDLLHLLKSEFVQYGGHAQAAGFSLEKQRIPDFIELVLKKTLSSWIIKKPRRILGAFIIHLTEQTLTSKIFSQILELAPYGINAPHPVIKLKVFPGGYTWRYLGKTKEHIKVEFPNIFHCKIEAIWFFVPLDKVNKLDKISYFYVEPHYNYFKGQKKHQLKILRCI